MEQTLTLFDYSPVPPQKEIKDFCRDLQDSLDADPSGIVVLGEPEESGKSPTVFQNFAGTYMTQSYAGVLSFRGHTVHIQSRFDTGGQPHFLRYAFEKTPMEDTHLRLLTQMDAPMELGSFSPLVAHLFLRQLRHAFALGTYRQYRTFYHNDSKLRGAIDISRHIRLNPMKNGAIAYSTRDYTLDNPINQLILAAEQCLLSHSEYRSVYRELLEREPHLAQPFQTLRQTLGTQEWTHGALQRLLQRVSTPITHPFHQRYEAVRKTAIWILRGQGMSPLSLGGAKVSGVLIPMPGLWELFLQHTLLDGALAQQKLGVIRENDQGQPRRIFKPDFLMGVTWMENNLTAQVVLDAKYRAAWSKISTKKKGVWSDGVREDVFQILSYMLTTQAKKGVVLYPTQSPDTLRRHQIYPTLPHQFYTLPICIPSSKDMTYQAYCQSMEAACKQAKDLLKEVYLTT